MDIYLKLIPLLIKRIFTFKKSQMTDNTITRFRVYPFDLDINFHMNNGRFFTTMDIGRFDMLLCTGFFFKVFKGGFYPVVLSESMVFRRSLNLFNSYELHTKVESWDKNFFYISQKFYLKNEIVASANVRACFKKRGRKGLVPVQELFEFMGEKHDANQMSEVARRQIELDEAIMPRPKK